MGSPRVAPLFHFSDVISMIYVRIRHVNRFYFSYFHPYRPIIDLIP